MRIKVYYTLPANELKFEGEIDIAYLNTIGSHAYIECLVAEFRAILLKPLQNQLNESLKGKSNE